jgi:hypothetical protein
MPMPTSPPDLTARPLGFTVERAMTTLPDVLFRAWTAQFDRWFAAPGTVLMRQQVDAPSSSRPTSRGSAIPTTAASCGWSQIAWSS